HKTRTKSRCMGRILLEEVTQGEGCAPAGAPRCCAADDIGAIARVPYGRARRVSSREPSTGALGIMPERNCARARRAPILPPIEETTTMVSRRQFLTIGAGGLAAASLPSRAIAQAPAGAPKRGGTLNLRTWDPPHFDHILAHAYKTHVVISFTH